jgi:archaellum component FlaC
MTTPCEQAETIKEIRDWMIGLKTDMSYIRDSIDRHNQAIENGGGGLRSKVNTVETEIKHIKDAVKEIDADVKATRTTAIRMMGGLIIGLLSFLGAWVWNFAAIHGGK